MLYAQPIVDLRSGETVQHELLLRMREPDGRIVSPDDFLPVAEKYALIGEIDWWVIKRATQLAGDGCPVQLNISARSVCDPDVLEHIERCIEQCQVAPGMLVFEITETAIVEDAQAALQVRRAPADSRLQAGAGRFRHRLWQPDLSQADSRRFPEDRYRVRPRSCS